MEVDKEKQAQAMAKAKQALLQAEIKRDDARLNQGVALFLQEQFDILLNDVFVDKLAPHITRLYRGDQRKSALALLDKLEKSICHEQREIRERSLMVMMILSEHVYSNNIKELSSIVAGIGANWLFYETEFISGFEPVCLQLQRIIVAMLATEQWYEVEQLIVTMNRISTKTLQKNNLIHGVVSRVHAKLAEPEVLDALTAAYLQESSQRKEVVENILLNMGREGTRFLIQKLAHSSDKDERLALIDLIPRMGRVSVPVLVGYLADPQPWYVTRNIVMIVSRLGDDALYQEVRRHLAHEDIRVQQQVLNCIEVLGGPRLRERLLEALGLISDELKAHLVDLLAQFQGPDMETALLGLFDRRRSFGIHVHDYLIAKLCARLTAYPSPRTVATLSSLIEERLERYGEHDSLARAAKTALERIEAEAADQTFLSGAVDEDQVNTLLDDQELAPAPAAREDFSEAYQGGLSDIFVESLTDSMADRAGAHPPGESAADFQPHPGYDHHLMIWSTFYEKLETDEANAFFAALTPMTRPAGDFLVQEGDRLTDLIFIDHGYASLTRSAAADEVVFAPLQGGEIVGSQGFFMELPWSMTIQAQTEIHVRLLKKSRFEEISAALPALKGKLESFCGNYDIIAQLVHWAAENPPDGGGSRVEVHNSSGLKNEAGETIGEHSEGRLSRTGAGGFTVVLPLAHTDNVHECLGHQVAAELILEDGTRRSCFGLIGGGGYYRGAGDLMHLHVKLYHPLPTERYDCASIQII